ncbi:MAG: hypothetical protein AMXMBFR34_15750 [Myxococcaceae bacterium]
MGEELAGLARSQFGLWTREQALACGFTEQAIQWRIESGTWVRVFAGVYRLSGTPVTWTQQAFGAVMLGGPGSALSHYTSAFLLKLDGLCDRPPPRIDLTVPRSRSFRAPELRLHHARTPLTLAWSGRLRHTTADRTLLDLCDELTPAALELALDSAHRIDAGAIARLQRQLAQPQRGIRGSSTLRELLALRTEGATDSPLESKVLAALRKTALPRPTPGLEVFDTAGYVMRVDFAWPDHLTALHVDGYRWHYQRERFERAARQRSRLAALGWTSLVVTQRSFDSGEWLPPLEATLTERAPQRSLFTFARVQK